MPDITMCPGHGCPLRDECYRFIATPNEFRQSWFCEEPGKDGKCDYQITVPKDYNDKNETEILQRRTT